MRSVQGPLPILFSIGFVVVIVALGARHVFSWPDAPRYAGAVFLALYLLWLVGESRVATREIGKEETRLDRGTMELYAMGRLATVVCAIAPAGPPPSVALAASGLVVFVGWRSGG